MRSVAIKSMLGSGVAFTALLLAHASMALAHWPGQPEHQMARLGDLQLEGGGVIKNLRISYVTHGKLNAAKDNAILFMHGWAANHHSGDHLIGPGKPLDTDKYFILRTEHNPAMPRRPPRDDQVGSERSSSPRAPTGGF